MRHFHSHRPCRPGPGIASRAVVLLGLALGLAAPPLAAQEVRISDLTIQESEIPVRLVGYGLVIGLDGTGDRAIGGSSGGHTVQSVANLLRRFDIDVPAQVLRTRNVAAVLVTAELSPYLRPGGRFDVSVSSLGDARSIRGGVLWMTPLIPDVGAIPVATAQGPLLVSEGGSARGSQVIETTARIPAGGVLEGELERPNFATSSRLLLREPHLGTALRIASAINAEFGEGMASLEDPGSIQLALPEASVERYLLLSRIGEVRVEPDRPARLVIDSRDGTVVAGGEVAVGPAVVSHGVVTLSIGGVDEEEGAAGDLWLAAGTPAQQIAAALHAIQTPPSEIAAIFESLREVGALRAEVVIR